MSPGMPVLVIDGLNVHYGRAHALQDVSLTLERGVISVVGRNGMGKTTLCNAITGLVRATGSVRFIGQELLGMPAHRITRLGIGYVPQGRRVWPSLSVHEHLLLSRTNNKKSGPWTVERIYATFPRLAERKANGGAQLSGGEQQMLAIARALLLNPKLLVMDEPTEGLAPVIVQQVEAMLTSPGLPATLGCKSDCLGSGPPRTKRLRPRRRQRNLRRRRFSPSSALRVLTSRRRRSSHARCAAIRAGARRMSIVPSSPLLKKKNFQK